MTSSIMLSGDAQAFIDYIRSFGPVDSRATLQRIINEKMSIGGLQILCRAYKTKLSKITDVLWFSQFKEKY